LKKGLGVVLAEIERLTAAIAAMDALVVELATKYPETSVLRQVPGVGHLTAVTFVLTIADPQRFRRSRQVGAYLGLIPRQRQSGERDPKLRITKSGDPYLRQILVSSAHYILGPFGPDSDLRRQGEQLAQRGDKRRAVVAIARRLAVLLHRLWVTGEVYEPLRLASRKEQLVTTA
jgi:transposase